MKMSEIRNAVKRAEEHLGIKIDGSEAVEVLIYSMRKCRVIKKDSSYLPILYENELIDYFSRMAINLRSLMREVK